MIQSNGYKNRKLLPLAAVLLVIFLIALPTCPQSASGQSTTNTITSVLQLIDQISADYRKNVKRDEKGEIIELTVPNRFTDDHSLQLISELHSIKKLTLGGGNAKPDSPGIPTAVGVGHLAEMEQLQRLSFVCFVARGLRPGVLQKASAIKQLREFQLYYSRAPLTEYASLTNLANLQRLQLAGLTNFGDSELIALKGLTKLQSVALDETRVTERGTNLLNSALPLASIVYSPNSDLRLHRDDAPFRYIGRIIDISIRAPTSRPVLANWRVEAEVIATPVGSSKDMPAVGAHVVFFVHSIVQTFNLDAESVTGRTFNIEYADGFANPYEGNITVK